MSRIVSRIAWSQIGAAIVGLCAVLSVLVALAQYRDPTVKDVKAELQTLNEQVTDLNHQIRSLSDHLVSISDSILDLNARQLKESDPAEREAMSRKVATLRIQHDDLSRQLASAETTAKSLNQRVRELERILDERPWAAGLWDRIAGLLPGLSGQEDGGRKVAQGSNDPTAVGESPISILPTRAANANPGSGEQEPTDGPAGQATPRRFQGNDRDIPGGPTAESELQDVAPTPEPPMVVPTVVTVVPPTVVVPERGFDVQVFAARPWQLTGLGLKPRDVVSVTYRSGLWTGGMGASYDYDAEGDLQADWICSERLVPVSLCDVALAHERNGRLVGRVGDLLLGIGRGRSFVIYRSGPLELRMNDHDTGLFDNRGSIRVHIVTSRHVTVPTAGPASSPTTEAVPPTYVPGPTTRSPEGPVATEPAPQSTPPTPYPDIPDPEGSYPPPYPPPHPQAYP